MGLRYRNAQGVEIRVAGLTPGGGDLEYGAIATRTGTFTIPAIAADDTTEKMITVTFVEDMPDNDFIVIFNDMSSEQCIFRSRNKTVSGFTTYFMNVAGTYVGSHNVNYTAFKLYTVADAEHLISQVDRLSVTIPVSASSTNQLATTKQVEDVDSSLQEAIDNINDVIPATASITNKLLTKANIDSKLDIYTSDDTQWDTIPIQNSTKPVTSGGVYNVVPQYTAGTGTINTTYCEGGTCNWYKYGRFVYVRFNGIRIKQDLNSTEQLITGLPRPLIDCTLPITGNSGTAMQNFVVSNGYLRSHYTCPQNIYLTGCITYMSLT